MSIASLARSFSTGVGDGSLDGGNGIEVTSPLVESMSSEGAAGGSAGDSFTTPGYPFAAPLPIASSSVGSATVAMGLAMESSSTSAVPFAIRSASP